MNPRLLPLLIAASLVACGPDVTPDPVGPGSITIAATSPVTGSAEVGVVTSLSIEFSAPISESSLVVAANPPTELGYREVSADGLEVSYANVILKPNSLYTITVSATGREGQSLGGSPTFSFTTGAAPDRTPPGLLSSRPAHAASDVAASEALTLTFSEPMDVSSLNTSSEPPHEFGTPVWSAGDTVATFSSPLSQLVPGQSYVVTINASDKAGNPLAGAAPIAFTVATPADLTAPEIVNVAPAAAATAIAPNTSLSLTFSERMNKSSVEAALSISPAIAGTLTWDATDALLTLQPSAPLSASTSYTVTVAASAADLAGNGLSAPYSFGFSTAAAPDTTKPSVESSLPAAGDTGVSRTGTIRVNFSEAMNKASAQSAFSITAPAGFNTGNFSWSSDGKSMTFNPTAAFSYGEPIAWRVTTAALDLAGNALVQQVSRGFVVTRHGIAVLDSVAALDGYVKSSGTVNADGTTMYVGDDLQDATQRALVSFDLSALPPTTKRIMMATLYVYVSARNGEPLVTLGGAARLERVAHGATLTSSAYDVSRFTGINDSVELITTTTTGWKLTNRIALGVGDDWNNRATRGSRSQFRIQPPSLASSNGIADWIQLYSGNTNNSFCTRTNAAASGASCKPHLVVEYEYP